MNTESKTHTFMLSSLVVNAKVRKPLRFRLLQVPVEKRKNISDHVWVGDVHVGHVFLNDEPMFQSNFLALVSEAFHLSHAELLV
jgi:hypothetical protein